MSKVKFFALAFLPILIISSFILIYPSKTDAVKLNSKECVDCHVSKKITASAIRDWQLSKHYEAEVGCADCHIPVKEAVKEIHESKSNCEDKRVRRLVSPKNCAQCHEDKVNEFERGKHALAWVAMMAMPTTKDQPSVLIEGEKGCGGCHRIGRDEGKCDACHTRHRF
ncbi:multiheme c-type cytochrome, partial [Candidatus Kryptobacter tengchongensis]